MYARRVSMKLKPNSATAFTTSLEKEVIPMLRKQKGFRDEMTFVSPGGADALAISMWDQKENAEEYGHGAYPGALQTLKWVVEGTPRVQSYEVSNSTLHKIAVAPAA